METLEFYRTSIRDLLEHYAGPDCSDDKVQAQVVIDTEHDHYQLVHVGWINDHRIFGCVLHIDIQDDKIWIQHDGTEVGMANDLMDLGIPSKQIVLGYHSPYKRQFTDFATG